MSFRQHAARRRMRAGVRRGFTLIEVLLVLIILVVIGSLVAPNIFGIQDQADRTAAKAQIAPVKAAIRLYKLNMGKYPASLDDLFDKPTDEAQAEKWGTEAYLDEKLPTDPWGNEYQYAQPGEHNTDSFDFWSNGPDGETGTDDDIGNWE
jgi:general secretion pathway protein G